jgi:broad specificity phosphatase PhoE
MKVYLIRHAQSSENARGLHYRMSQSTFNVLLRETPNAPLTALGVRQAQQVVSALAGTSIERLYTSPFVRAATTARILGHAWKLDPQIMPDLREVMPKPFPESQREHPIFQLFLRGYLRLLLPGSTHESWFGVYRRAQRVWQVILREPVTSVAIVSHFAFLHMLLVVAHIRWRCPLLTYQHKNGGITCIEIPCTA